MPQRLDGALDPYAKRLEETVKWLDAVSTVLAQHRDLMRIFTESNVVLAVAYYEQFLRSLLSHGARYRQPRLRKHLSKGASLDEQTHIRTCDLPALIRVLRKRFSFKKDARSIDGLFVAIFGVSAWPSIEARDLILDLVLVRNMMVHEGGTDVGIGGPGSYASQLRRREVLHITTYGTHSVYRIDHPRALTLFLDALNAIREQALYFKSEFEKDDFWDKSILEN